MKETFDLISAELPAETEVIKRMDGNEEVTELVYRSAETEEIDGQILPKVFISISHKDPQKASEGLLESLKANDLGYDQATRSFSAKLEIK